MNALGFDWLAREVFSIGTRRGLLRLSASLPLAGSLGALVGDRDSSARKKHKKKHKKRKKCGKAGGKPVKGKCCAGSALVSGICQCCDVCSLECAFASVQEAIDAASDGDTIALCPGAYRGNLTIDRDLTLVGLGDADGTNGTIVRGAGATSVVRIESANVALRNLRVTGGGGADGAGIFNSGGTLELIDCAVNRNTAGSGGGIYNNGTLTLTRCIVGENTARFGGGITNFMTLSLIESDIRGNTAPEPDGRGGGIFNGAGATVELDAASRVTENTAGDTGGGIYNNGGTVTLDNPENLTANTPDNCTGCSG
jgi:hypothetical protein